MADRSLWFESHLLHDRAGRRARLACERLGAAAHEKILLAGDRLAATSPAIAQQFYRHAADVWQAVGVDDFDRWLRLGEGFLHGSVAHREAAMAYFGVLPRVIAAAGLARVAEWCDAGTRVATVSRKLGGTYFEGTAALIHKLPAEALDEWARNGLRLHGAAGWRGEFLAHAYFLAAPEVLSVLTASELELWADLGVALQPNLREAQFFTKLPAGWSTLKPEERTVLLTAALRLADVSRPAAAAVYRDLGTSVRRLHGTVRMTLLSVFAQAATATPDTVADIVRVVGALVHDVPAASRLAALDLAHTVARTFPSGAIALLRSLPVAYESVRHDAVVDWVTRGLEIAQANTAAGVAYFALESRTSFKVLHASSTAATLSDVQGLLRKYVHMLSGDSVSIRSTEVFQLRPPLEEFPIENEIALPLKIDICRTHEDNCAVYSFLAAQLAGRREFGTYRADLPQEFAGNLFGYLRAPVHPPLLEELFLVAEGFRVAAGMARSYPGLARQQQQIAQDFLARQDALHVPSQPTLMDALLAWLLSGDHTREQPFWLRPMAAALAPCVAPLASREATVNDALEIARQLTAQLAEPGEQRAITTYGELALDRAMAEALIDPYLDDDSPAPPDAPRVDTLPGPKPTETPNEYELQLQQTSEDSDGATSPLSPEELQRLLEAGVDLRLKQGYGSDVEGLGLYITDLLGKLPSAQIEELRQLLLEAPRSERTERRRWLERRAEGVSFYYDEWDYHISDYRQRWCRLLELAVDGDSGEFYNQALSDYAHLIPEIRRQFQRIRPEMYRVVRGLEDGEDFDLNAVVDARVDRRARRPPSPKLYVARTREERDVATLFLIDMSASTDEPLQKMAAGAGVMADSPGALAPKRNTSRRIIDITKEALVVMAQALEEIGDAYAIYGFSGHGRDNVEFYLVKSFSESLSAAVKGRIGAIEPKRSTRMGTALRHATEKMTSVNSRSRHIILLSDGFPQDFDYGQDRRSNVYGLRDTTVALRECEATGITPFCITVDKAGHDYLREMCDESRYMVIEDIAALPRELPKIYQRVVNG